VARRRPSCGPSAAVAAATTNALLGSSPAASAASPSTVKRVFITYYADIADVVQKGPCRNVLAPREALKKFESSMRRFDDAVAELAHGNRAAYDRLDSTEADLDDPTPCRPS
jgi:hypothetical protein